MKKRIIKICAVCFISLIICSQFLVCASAYSEDYPDYLSIGNCAFIECNTNIGAGTFVFPIECRENKISFYNSYLQNVTGSYISGKFILYDNTVYDVRGQNLSNFQYIYKTGYNTEYRDISINSITNTNINFSLANYTRENTVVVLSDFDKIILTCVLLDMSLTVLITLFLILYRGKKQ